MNPTLRLILVIAIAVEVFSLLPVGSHEFEPANTPHQPYLLGAINIHSKYSVGSGSVPKIAEAANRSGLNFVVITDLDTAKARRDGFEKVYDRVDAFIEMEATTPGGHALVFYSESPHKNETDPQIAHLAWEHVLNKENPANFFTVIAHPSNIKFPWSSLDRFPEGVEIMNFDSSWRRQIDDSILGFGLTLLTYPFNNYLAAARFSRIYPKDLSSLDDVNAVTPGHFGILGHDVRAKLKLNDTLSLPWPSYEKAFRTAANVVFYKGPLSSDFDARKHQIYQAIREGRSAVVFRYLHSFDGNEWHLQCGEKNFSVGDEVVSEGEKCEFQISTPEKFPYPITLRLWKNGQIVAEKKSAGSHTTIPTSGRGAYRLEVWAKVHTLFRILMNDNVPYVLYNSIYLK